MAGELLDLAETDLRGGSKDYSRAWKAYARRRNLALFLLLGSVPFSVGAYLGAELWLNQIVVGAVAMVLWWAGACAAVWWAGEFRCPRCSRRFGALGSNKGFRAVWRGLFDSVCSNCKLRRWEQG